MRINKSWQRIVLFTACFGLIIPRSCLLAQTAASEIQDVALDAQGVLHGKLVDRQGQPLTNALVRMTQKNAVVVATTTDESGSFHVGSLRGGVYQLALGNRMQHLRVWAPQTAPPSAKQGITVALGDVQRGQGCTIDSCTGTCGGTCAACGTSGPMGFLMNPFVIGAAVAAAIAIPLALNNDDDDAS